MCDPALNVLLEQFSKTSLVGNVPGVSFRGQGLKLHAAEDADKVVESIVKCPDMMYLDLEGNTLGVDAAAAIGEALKTRPKITRALWKDMFTGRMKTEIPIALRHLSAGLQGANAQLRELDLSDNAFGPIGVEALADLLSSPVCYNLQELRLNNNGLGVTGGKMLANALLAAHRNSVKAGHTFALKVFIAGRNRLENEGSSALSQVFKTLGSLEEISMPQNGIYHKGIRQLSEALQSNKNLRILNLNDNTLTVRGAVYISEALPSLSKLEVLNLGDCLLKTAGALALSQALTHHHHLQEVVLDSNEIGAEGGIAMAKALSNKTRLNKLVLTANAFGPAGRKALQIETAKFQRSNIVECPSDEDEEIESEEEDGEDEEETDESGASGSEDDEGALEKSDMKSGEESVNEAASSGSVDATILQFLMEPTAHNFSKLSDNNIDAIVESLRIPPSSMDVETCVKLIMKMSNLGSSKAEAVRSRSSEMAIELYKALFSWADQNQQLSAVNNVLFVYLQLIKDEERQVKISWDVSQCVKVLQSAIQTKCVPTFTQHILTCCLERKQIDRQKPQQISL